MGHPRSLHSCSRRGLGPRSRLGLQSCKGLDRLRGVAAGAVVDLTTGLRSDMPTYPAEFCVLTLHVARHVRGGPA